MVPVFLTAEVSCTYDGNEKSAMTAEETVISACLHVFFPALNGNTQAEKKPSVSHRRQRLCIEKLQKIRDRLLEVDAVDIVIRFFQGQMDGFPDEFAGDLQGSLQILSID